MIVCKCPLRISLAGGSTDLQSFIDTYGFGSVINFPCNLYTYITLFQDKYGYNKQKKYIINYTKREEVDNLDEIKNDVARVVLKHFECEHITIDFRSDVFSAGSGLASSSSYLIACIKAVSSHMNIYMDEFEICKLAIKLERKFNPLTGYQDIYGCGLSGFKQLTFSKDGTIQRAYFENDFLKNFKMYLRPTGVRRRSTDILSTINLEKTKDLIPFVVNMSSFIKNKNKEGFIDMVKESWETKKKTSRLITQDPKIKEMDKSLSEDDSVLAHRLCGAGNGGFFLVFKKPNYNRKTKDIEIKISDKGLTLDKI